jgi:hypothetical protein
MSTVKFTNKSKNGKSPSIPIYANGKVIGYVRRDTFYKSILPKHYLEKPPAIAFSVDSLYQSERAGAVRVQVTDRDTKAIYRATIAAIREHGIPLCRGGFEPQIALPLERWSKQTPGAPVQPSLWSAA